MKSLVALLAVTGLLASAAFAAPKALSSAAMDKVSAGSGMLDWFIGGTGNVPVGALEDGGLEVTDNALAENNAVAIAGDENNVGVFAEDNEDSAIALAEGSKATYNDVDADYALVTGDGAEICLDVTKVDYEIEDIEDGFAFIGDNNEAYYDASEIDGELEDDAYGVIAREACVTDSFNYCETDIEVDVEIEDSFNVTTNCLEICPSNTNAIVLAGSLGFQGIGVNVSLTTASAAVPTMQGDASASLPIIAGNAIALTAQAQINIVNTVILADLDLGNGPDLAGLL